MTASNRAAMLYGDDPRALAAALDDEAASTSRSSSRTARPSPGVSGRSSASRGRTAGWELRGDVTLLDDTRTASRAPRRRSRPERGRGAGLGRARLGVRRPRRPRTTSAAAATARWPRDSLVPLVTVGFDTPVSSITDVAPAILERFGVEPPAYARLPHAA